MRNTRTGSRRTFAVVAVAVLVAVGGCGGGNASGDQKATDEKDVARVMSDLQTASRAGDGQRVCGQIFTPKLADSVTKAAKSGSCATEVKKKLFSPNAKITVENVDVQNPANATATIKEANGNTSSVFLVKQSGRWRIRSVQPA
jgi:hypothetical protein